MFQDLPQLPEDPILGLMTSFRKDPRGHKVDLGVGVYRDELGNTPVLSSVVAAEQALIESQTSKAYIGPAGNHAFNEALARLVLGDAACLSEGRVAMVQTPGGCGALRVTAELINVVRPGASIWVSDPTWANHIPLLGNCGLNIKTYPYFDYATSGVDFASMCDTLKDVERGDLVLLHGSCHNPSGADLTLAQWLQLADIAEKRGFVPFVDVAYQGFGEGVEEDVAGLRALISRLPEVVVAVSCSKNFGLYRERVGLAMVMCPSQKAASAAVSHMLSIVRGIYSMPPDHGAALVAGILNDPVLKSMWLDEVTAMRARINGLRRTFSDRMRVLSGSNRFDFVQRQRGMFSFLGLTQDQVSHLREACAIYMLDSSRASIAGLNNNNIDYVCRSIASLFRPIEEDAFEAVSDVGQI